MDNPESQPRNNPAFGFKPREFALGLFVAAAIVFTVAGVRWHVRARMTSVPPVPVLDAGAANATISSPTNTPPR